MIPSARLRSLLSSATPLLTMAATLAAAAGLYRTGQPTEGVVGFAQAAVETVAPLELARVASIQVDIDQPVAAGQVVATLDTSTLDAELALARAEEARLDALIPAEQARLERQIQQDRDALMLELARAREEQRRVSAEQEALSSEISRVKRMVEDKQASIDALRPLDLRRAEVQALAAEKPRTLGLLQEQIAAAEERRRKIREPMGAAMAPIEADRAVIRRRIEHLERRRSGYVLRATGSGRVSALRRRPGEVVEAGGALVEIVSARDRVVACLLERAALRVQLGDAAKLWARGVEGPTLKGRVVALDPLVAELPPRCRAAPTVPVWGRNVTIALDPPTALLAGQAFDVAFEGAGAPASSPPAARPGAPPAGEVRMTVPAALRARSRVEPSGLLARPREERYVIVSDDTGHEKNNEGAPWLFAMSRDGTLDPEPLHVLGVEELADVESISAGEADDELYLLSSQGHSAKGRRKPARTALLRLRADGRGFRVDGEVHLAELLDAAGPSLLSALGLPEGTRPLEIEGMTSRGGALYLGLKAPLDPQGQAMIWKLAAPRALFETRRLEDARLSLWARARLDVELAGATVPGGISELLFLPDGSLAIASTPSAADGAAGSLWRVERADDQGGVLSPRLERRFPHLKPEGLAPSLSPGKMIVVFDEGPEIPELLELPWQG